MSDTAIQPATSFVDVTVNTAVKRCRAVYIGTSQDLDFSVDGTTWVTFQGCVVGSILPISVSAARKTAGAAAPTTKDVVFLY
jgi:hypothetical protein